MLTRTRFDNRLPDGIQEVFQTCHKDGLALSVTNPEIDFRGTCPLSTQFRTTAASTVFLALSTNPPFKVDFPSPLFHPPHETFGEFTVPLQNCYVTWDTEVHFGGFRFKWLYPGWVQRPSGPALRLGFATPPKTPNTMNLSMTYKLAHQNTIATAFCESPINEQLVRSKLDGAKINSSNDVLANDIHLDLYFVFSVKNGAIDVKVETDFKPIGLDPGIDWDKLPKRAKTQFESRLNGMTKTMNSELNKHVQGLAALLIGPMQSAIPQGHKLCSVYLENSQLVVATAGPEVTQGCP